MGQKEKSLRRKLPVWKKLLFSLLVCAMFFAILELILFVCGVQPILYQRDPYVGFTSSIPLFVQAENDEGAEVMVRATNKKDFFNAQEFPVEKDSDAFRIFCLGGSTTHGRPFNDNSSFCGWLRELLPEIDPSRKWEVINAGGISYATYRVALLMEELVDYDPDLFIIYSGHNEFLEHRTYADIIATPSSVRGVAAWAARTRTYSLIQGFFRPDAPQTKLSSEVETQLDRSIGPSNYTRDDELRKQILAHFRYNLARMVDIARSRGARVLFVTPASNTRDCSPFKSEHRSDLAAEDLDRWKSSLDIAKGAWRAADYHRALSALGQAKAIDDRYANVHFLEGRVLEQIGRFDQARRAYVRARDEDVCPLRALTQMPVIVREIAASRDVAVVDYAADVEKRAENGIPGKKQFLDHVHPTIQEHLALASAIVDRLCLPDGPLKAAGEWKDPTRRAAVIDRAKVRVTARIDREAHGLAMMNLSKVMGWAGKTDDAYTAARRAVEFNPQLAEAHYHLASSAQKLGKFDEAAAHYRLALDVDVSSGAPSYYPGALNNMGILHARKDELSHAATYYRRAIEADSKFVEAHYNLAVVYSKQDDLDNATYHFEQAVGLLADNPAMRMALAAVYVKTGRLGDAKKQASKALELARRQGRADLVKQIESQVKLYEQRIGSDRK